MKMATKTTNYNLTKPSGTESADIDVINANMDIIDSALKENQITVDSALSSTSTNPLQNKVVNNAIYNLGVQIRAEIPKITISSTGPEPSAGSHGDIWLQYEGGGTQGQ